MKTEEWSERTSFKIKQTMANEKIHISREVVEAGDYTADKGVIVLIAPLGVETVHFMLGLSSKILGDKKLPQGKRRYPNDGLSSVLRASELSKTT
jgi:hypothetical protein